jgi:hypothetical protein
MSPDDRAARVLRGRLAALQDAAQDVGTEPLQRERDEVQRGQRPSAHRVHVRQRVGRGDPAEVVRVIDDRREEVDGLDERQIRAHGEHGRVVGAGRADQQPRIGRRLQLAHDRQQVGGGQLATAAGTV